MRKWIWLIVLGGCISTGESDCSYQQDPCPGHAVTGWFQLSDCRCPLKSELLSLDGKACTDDGLYCSEGTLYASDSCRCERGAWNCKPLPDMSMPIESPQDLSTATDLSTAD